MPLVDDVVHGKNGKNLFTSDLQNNHLLINMSDFVKTWPLGFRLVLGVARLEASLVPKNVGHLMSWSVQLDSPGTALTVCGWIRPWGQNKWGREGAVLTQPLQ